MIAGHRQTTVAIINLKAKKKECKVRAKDLSTCCLQVHYRDAFNIQFPFFVFFFFFAINAGTKYVHRRIHFKINRRTKKIDAFSARVAKFRIHFIRFHKSFMLISYKSINVAHRTRWNRYIECICITAKMRNFFSSLSEVGFGNAKSEKTANAHFMRTMTRHIHDRRNAHSDK